MRRTQSGRRARQVLGLLFLVLTHGRAVAQSSVSESLAESGKTEDTPREGVLGAYYFGAEIGVVSIGARASDRAAVGDGAHLALRVGFALFDHLAFGFGWFGFFLHDRNPISAEVVACSPEMQASGTCHDTPTRLSTSIVSALLSAEIGYQHRFRPWATASLLPGILRGYMYNYDGVNQQISACQDCPGGTLTN